MNKVYYTVYQVTNKISGKVYIGTHKTQNLDDGYMGSGKYLNHAIRKHGVKNFRKEILHIYDTPDEMYAREAELVNEDFLATASTYNLKSGGFGGWDYVNSTADPAQRKQASELGCKKIKQKIKEDPEFREKYRQLARKNLHSPEAKAKAIKKLQTCPPFRGKKHSEQAKKKIGQAASIRQAGEKNSQYGTRWIHSPEQQLRRKIRKEDPLPPGWQEGQKINWCQKPKSCLVCDSVFEGKGVTCCHACKKERLRRREQDRAYKLFEEFVRSSLPSITQFAKKKSVTQPGLTKMFRKHITGYAEIAEQGKATHKAELKKLLRDHSSIG